MASIYIIINLFSHSHTELSQQLVVESGSFTESYISGGGGGSIAATPTFLSAERNATNL